jgi:type IV pilus assembly protein PilA
MRTFIKNYIDAKKRQKLEESGEEGFSLIELIVVIVIIGILVAIAIPVFLNIQSTARQSAVEAAATNGATAVSAAIAADGDDVATDIADALAANEKGNIELENVGSADDVEGVCVQGTDSTDADAEWFAGPAALADGSACDTP